VRRLLIPVALAAVLLVSSCGDERPATVREPERSVSAAPTKDPTPIGTPTPATTPRPTAGAPTGALAGFPLAYGLPDENGDDHSPVTVTSKPATSAFDTCGVPTWDPRVETTDVIGVEFRGEAEWAVGRTLVLYPDTHGALTAVQAAHDAIAGCPDEAGGHQDGSTHTIVDTAIGDQSLVWTDTFYTVQHGEQLHGTGLVVYELVRVGRGVLMTYAYGEGNGSPESREQSVFDASQEAQTLVRRMQELPATEPPTGPGRNVPGVWSPPTTSTARAEPGR
jgi:hypothetical protein